MFGPDLFGRRQSQQAGLDKLEAVAKAMGFPPQLWFGGKGADQAPDAALAAALEDETAREILGEVIRMGPKDRRLLLSIARQIASTGGQGPGDIVP